MPRSRDLALDIWLLMAAATFLLLGGTSLLANLLLQLPDALGRQLVLDGGLLAVLSGVALLATLQRWRLLRLLAGTAFTALLVYSVGHNLVAGDLLRSHLDGVSLLTGGPRLSSLASLALLPCGVALTLGQRARLRPLWAWGGLLQGIAGLMLLIALLALPDIHLRATALFASSPLLTLSYLGVLGSALAVAGFRDPGHVVPLGYPVLAAGIAGVLVSCLAWLMLIGQHQARLHQQGEYVLDAVEVNAGAALESHRLLMQRMAQRLQAAPDGIEPSVLEADVDNYLTDTPSLQAVGLMSEDSWRWQHARRQPLVDRLARLAGVDDASEWMAERQEAGILLPDTRASEQLLMLLPVPRHNAWLVALFDLARLLDDLPETLVDGYRVEVTHQGRTITVLGVAEPNNDASLAMPRVAQRSIAPAGEFRLGLLAVSLALVRQVTARSRELDRARHSLWQSEQRYRSLFAYNPDAVFSLDRDGHFRTVNPTCSEISGYDQHQLIASHFRHFLHAEGMAEVEELFHATLEGLPQRAEITFVHRDGAPRRLDLTTLPIIVDRRVTGIFGIAKDITERRERELRLRLLERSVEASTNGIVVADALAPDLPIRYANPAFERISGYPLAEILGRNCRFLQGAETDPEAVKQLREALAAQREVHVTLCNYRRDGSPFWNDLYISPVRDAQGQVTHFVGVQHDISEHKAYEAQLAHHASHDALTGLANRSLFEDRLAHDVELARWHGERLAVLFIDLDDFKPINDSLGHAVGDRVLVEVARRLSRALRLGDTLARLGGDEFVVLLPSLENEEQAQGVAERLLALVARPYRVAGHELHLTSSIGIAIGDDELENPLMLIQQADMAMYKAKQQGRNAYQWFTPEITARVNERVALRHDLQEAIDNDQLALHYQPQLDREGRVVGVEALLRWAHPERGVISPGTFIPLAEETGQIIPISQWVLRRACRDLLALSGAGHAQLSMSVNLSPLQFHRANFLASLREALAESRLPAARLTLELTEGILMDDTEAAIDTLHALRGMGVGVDIDDFGTGYSSLSYLKHLPINTVKIDRSFVSEVTQSADDAAIVQAIIAMAHHLGLMVVAEGIEEEAQRQFLLEHGCDRFQGFLLGRPMPLDDLKAWLDRR
ncbi:MAG: putative bifunctional diguanylate cyclase/phosphodiesterase [Pseudomonadota bacterium]